MLQLTEKQKLKIRAKYPEHLRRRIVRAFEKKLSFEAIAKHYGIYVQGVKKILITEGVECVAWNSPERFTEDVQKNMCKLYNDGKSMNDLVRIYRATAATVKQILENNGVQFRTHSEALSVARISIPLDVLKTEYPFKTASEIADEWRVPRDTVTSLVYRHGIKKSPRKAA